MTGICGWARFPGPHADTQALRRMVVALQHLDAERVTLATEQACALAAVTLDKGPCLSHQDEAMAAIDGDLRFTDSALAERARGEGAARALLHGFRDRGLDLLQSLSGRFSIAVVLPQQRRALIAVDRLGSCPLTYTWNDNSLVFGSNANVLRAHTAASPEILPQALFDYLYFHMIPSPRTVYRGWHRLPPAGYVQLEDGCLTDGRYWHLRYSRERDTIPIDRLKPQFCDLLRTSVHQAVDGRTTGAFLSGGTDSSTIAGVLGQVTGCPARTYSIGFAEEGYDEMEYARIAARHFQTVHHEYYVTPQDVITAIPKIAKIYDNPFGNSSAVPTYYCALQARHDGVQRLLAGDGGDELFGGNARYATQYVLGHYGKLPQWLRSRLIEPLFSVPGSGVLPGVRKLRRYIEQASVPLPARLETYNLLTMLDPARVLTTDFLSSVATDEPLQQLEAVYRATAAETDLNRILAIDLKFTLADNDLPKVYKTCELTGVDVAFPLLSEAMVEFAAALPVSLKVRRTRLRYFFKEALRDFLPGRIIAKRKHGFGLPFGRWLVKYRPLRELVRDNLNDLKSRGIVRPDFIDALFDHYVPQHPAYYGTTVWILIMLEEWFKHHNQLVPITRGGTEPIVAPEPAR